MCARVTLTIDFETLKLILKTKYNIQKPHINPYNPRYNIAPSQNLISVISDGKNYRAGELNWGFVPPWSKDIKTSYKMINARAESIGEKPSFKSSFKQKRCVVLVDSYYEWKNIHGKKIPYRIMVKDQSLFSLAGLWTVYTNEDKSKHYSCVIITTEANELIKNVHERMPAILNDEDSKLWLDNEIEPNALKKLLKPYEPSQMSLYEVSKVVNNSRVDTKECILPI